MTKVGLILLLVGSITALNVIFDKKDASVRYIATSKVIFSMILCGLVAFIGLIFDAKMARGMAFLLIAPVTLVLIGLTEMTSNKQLSEWNDAWENLTAYQRFGLGLVIILSSMMAFVVLFVYLAMY